MIKQLIINDRMNSFQRMNRPNNYCSILYDTNTKNLGLFDNFNRETLMILKNGKLAIQEELNEKIQQLSTMLMEISKISGIISGTVSGVMKVRGECDSLQQLTGMTGMSNGDVYYIPDTNREYVYKSGYELNNGWIQLGPALPSSITDEQSLNDVISTQISASMQWK